MCKKLVQGYIKKDEFRDVKADYHAKHSQIEMSSAALESYIEETEVYFNSFEEWMYASEFEKAQEQFVYIQDHIFTLKKNLGMLPGLVEKIKGIAPHYIAEAERNYTETVNKGVFLQHLEVEKNKLMRFLHEGKSAQIEKLINRNNRNEMFHDDISICF